MENKKYYGIYYYHGVLEPQYKLIGTHVGSTEGTCIGSFLFITMHLDAAALRDKKRQISQAGKIISMWECTAATGRGGNQVHLSTTAQSPPLNSCLALIGPHGH